MKYFPLQVAIIIGAGLATGLGFALASKIVLHVPIAPGVSNGTSGGGSGGGAGPTGPTRATGSTGAPSKPGAASPAAVDKIDLAASKALFDKHNAVFIDARAKAEYVQAHIPGAMQLEKGDLDGQPPAKVLNYLPGVEIVVYCHGELCTDSENVVKRLLALNKGIGPMHIINDGFPGWQKAGYPVESGPEAGFQ